ncbi:Golgi membrane protein 1 [Zootoca vivipara]|uniref:Golgi membrane protein 1 n=1 Tax=Zootoca vivipara TaxID=8524 RepID=UPI00293BEC19|nr:Golgi membrane protein 1 [Zootoca vivipara]XP_034956050.2 Golgi membrane protein 1 [Zootoca vivipara]XP_060136081.1 Golgi membrane protein 1 [Zootoca vivipara]
MVGLGNSRRGMKSPPLLVAALVACIIVLGFNYWIASSRSIDLQNRIMELEGRVRRVAVERGAVEIKKNEFQGELQKQREQIDRIQSLHNFQMENTNKIHMDEKAMLMNNITTNERLIQNLKENLRGLQKECGRLQLDIYRFKKNQTNLQKKITFDMTQCISQMKELKEQCEERIEAACKKGSEIPEDMKNSSKILERNDQVNIEEPTEFQQQDLTKQGNELQGKHYVSDDSLKLEISKPTPPIIKNVAELDYRREKGTAFAVNKNEPKEEELSVDQDPQQIVAKLNADNKGLPSEPGKEQNPYEVEAEKQAEELAEAMRHQDANHGKADDEEVEREHLLNDDLQQDEQETRKTGEFGIKKVNQDNIVDYNLEMNEAESETDKQAALVDNQSNFNVQKLEDSNMQNHLFKLGEEHQQRL